MSICLIQGTHASRLVYESVVELSLRDLTLSNTKIPNICTALLNDDFPIAQPHITFVDSSLHHVGHMHPICFYINELFGRSERPVPVTSGL